MANELIFGYVCALLISFMLTKNQCTNFIRSRAIVMQAKTTPQYLAK
jgi:hypothetical protein